MSKSFLGKWWVKRQRRIKGLEILRRIKFRHQANIPQFPEDVKWFMSQQFQDWRREFPHYLRK